MMLSFVIKPYAIEVYSGEGEQRTFLGTEHITRIEEEAPDAYEQRMIFVCKELAQDAKKHVKSISNVEVILSYPWCTYEHIDLKKELPANTIVTNKVIESLKVQKASEGVTLLESTTSHILLNGYVVPQVLGQKAHQIEMQVLNIYTRTPFFNGLKKTIESIFHTHKVFISSVYTHALKGKQKNGFMITLEEESVDISYISNEKIILNVFIQTSYINLEQKLMEILDTDAKTVREILVSRAIHDEVDDSDPNVSKKFVKSMKHLWPDLHTDVRSQIDSILEEHYSLIMKYIYTMVDQVKMEHSFTEEEVRICALTGNLAKAYGFALAKRIRDDEYVQQVMRITDDNTYIDHLF